MARTYSITELAAEFGVTPRAIRFYEDRGLIRPRRDGQMRIYREGDRHRLIAILRGRRLGFSLAEIGELLELYKLNDGCRRQAAATLDSLRARIHLLERQRGDIDVTLKELRQFEQETSERLTRLEPPQKTAAE